MKFRGLNNDEIDVRVAMVGDGWAQLLLYKDARADMTLLDETVGPENWQREHYECKGNLFCKVGINVNYTDELKEPRWVWKSDCGSESNTEKEKGEASDSFKRACTNWGIGRELYTKIAIFVKVETYQTGSSWKLKNKERYTVKEIMIDKDANKIIYLQIADKNGAVVFTYKENKPEPKQEIKPEPQKTNIDNLEQKDIILTTAHEPKETIKEETPEAQPRKKIRVKREV